MHYYSIGSALAASPLPDLPFEKAADGVPSLFLTDRDPQQGPAAWRVTDARQLTAEAVDVSWLDPDRMGEIGRAHV